MALQGDLSSFSLSDVLHLLADTAKSGCLAVSAPSSSGEIWLRSGEITGGSASSSPHASHPADVVLELMRSDGGSFLFDDGTEVAGVDGVPVDDVLGAAETLLAEWREVEAVVPTLRAWITLAPNLDGDRDEVTLHADQWQAVAAVGGGATVDDLAARCELTDLAASQMIRDLSDARLVSVGEPQDLPAAEEQDDTSDVWNIADLASSDGADQLSELGSDQGPVVLSEGDGRLLPEPLPDETDSYEAPEIAMGAVDGRSFEAIEAEAATLSAEPGGPTGTVGDTSRPEPQHSGATSAYHRREDLLGAQGDGPTDEDRGSLLRFLSTVEP